MNMKLKEFSAVAVENYIVGVTKEGHKVDRFENENYDKLAKYQETTVETIHVYDENTMFVTVKM